MPSVSFGRDATSLGHHLYIRITSTHNAPLLCFALGNFMSIQSVACVLANCYSLIPKIGHPAYLIGQC